MLTSLRMTVSRMIWVLAVAVALGCSVQRDELEILGDFPNYPNASAVKRVRNNISGIEQILMIVEEDYPSSEALRFYREYLRSRGEWVECVDTIDGWDSFEDHSAPTQVLKIYRSVDYWISRDSNSLLMLSGTYRSMNIDVQRPDNNRQEVVVWAQRSDDLEKETQKLRVRCPALSPK